jgi:hypothetical protein
MNSKHRGHFFALMGTSLLVAAMLAVPATVFAQDQLANPSAAQYEPQSQVQGTSGSGGPGGPGVGSSPSVAQTPTGGGGNSSLGSLPFTGMDLGIVAGVALLLTGTGLALHRLSVPPNTRS